MTTAYGARVVPEVDANALKSNVDFTTVAGFVANHLNNYMQLVQEGVAAQKAYAAKDFQNWAVHVKACIDQCVILATDWNALNLAPSDAHAAMVASLLESAAINQPHVFGDGTLLKGLLGQLGTFLSSPFGQTLEQLLLNLILGGVKPPVPTP